LSAAARLRFRPERTGRAGTDRISGVRVGLGRLALYLDPLVRLAVASV
jgi:hypothetical protein